MNIPNMLTESLPVTVDVNGKVFPIDHGFKTMIRIEIIIFSKIPDEEKVSKTLNMFYMENVPADVDKAMGKMLWFYNCGKIQKPSETGGKPKKKQKRAYCFEADAGRIYAAFRSQYGLNLNSIKNAELHWWEFIAMFESLSEDLLISRVMFYRTADLSGMGKNQKAFIKKMRTIYAIEHSESTMDAQAKLAKRNRDMKEYIRKRMEECKKG